VSERGEVYERAKASKLTSMQTYEEFRPNDTITRAEMAKIVSLYATAFTPNKGLQPLAGRDTDADMGLSTCTTFTDLNQTNPELQSYIIQACKLGLMGYYSDGTTIKPAFDPNDPITVAEVATTISRLLRTTQYRGSEQRRYQNHLLAIQKAGYLPLDKNPMKNEERREVFQLLQKIAEG
jgi:hypothetical protein